MTFAVAIKARMDAYLTDIPSVAKAEGTLVWDTRESAQEFIDRHGMTDCAVYGVKADYDEDTYEPTPAPRVLKRPARIFSLESP